MYTNETVVNAPSVPLIWCVVGGFVCIVGLEDVNGLARYGRVDRVHVLESALFGGCEYAVHAEEDVELGLVVEVFQGQGERLGRALGTDR